MFDTYRAMRDVGLNIFSAFFTTIYILLIAGPILMFTDWYAGKCVGEDMGFEFDEDFDGNVEFIEDDPFGKFKSKE